MGSFGFGFGFGMGISRRTHGFQIVLSEFGNVLFYYFLARGIWALSFMMFALLLMSLGCTCIVLILSIHASFVSLPCLYIA